MQVAIEFGRFTQREAAQHLPRVIPECGADLGYHDVASLHPPHARKLTGHAKVWRIHRRDADVMNDIGCTVRDVCALDQIAEFAEYGFPKAHSTAYAFVTYQTAYLKANHPLEYWAALLSIEAGNHDKLARYIAHARDRGIDVRPPDVNESARDFTPVAEGIRFGLAGVKNVGEGAIESILGVRHRRQRREGQ